MNYEFCRCFQDDGNGKDVDVNENACPSGVQTAPIGDGVLPGVIRQLVIEVSFSLLTKCAEEVDALVVAMLNAFRHCKVKLLIAL